ncbi:phBC6A51 family helix-turn-helix protein [Bacillus cereus group sp. TH228LC]|uniref:phBC6A51 family helix-turn-helix protein n=1 Tax=Bacillus cereus group sp. TH228LC TaxID=3018049 RepID=UPI0022E81A5C|nr:phBC6A51 family helix-turn-helix protein [Bacillus cereus group sp. TH228LC]MDA1577581.1 phBC6A51 family helix-turn-helix protein [Bacillus cereus group sp. TH228LC]
MDLRDLRQEITEEQAQAAVKLVENSFAGRERKTLEEIAEELGISRTTLWTWSNDVNFIRYKELLADQLLRDNIDLANGQLLALIRGDFTANKTPSIKALELFYKLSGKLVDKKEIITNVDKPKVSQSEVEQTLAELGKGI